MNEIHFLARGHSPDWVTWLFLLVYSFEFWVGLFMVVTGLLAVVWDRGRRLWALRRIFGLQVRWILARMLWTLWLASGWLILLGSTGTAVWALVARQWWALAFALPPTAGSWCMRAWLVRYWREQRKPEQSGIGVPRSRANGPLRDNSDDILF